MNIITDALFHLVAVPVALIMLLVLIFIIRYPLLSIGILS